MFSFTQGIRPMKKTVLVLAAGAAIFTCAEITRAAEPVSAPLNVPSELTLREALRLALTANPRLQTSGWELRKAEGRTRQAGARPNPELSFDLENFGGSSSGSEATLSVGQLLELGGKRSARVGAARAEEQVVALDIQTERQVLVGEVTTRFIEALSAERSLALAEDEIRAAQEAATTNAQRVRAGAAHPVESRRAEVELASVRLERAILQSDADLARSRLSATWGEPAPRFERLVGLLDSLPPLPSIDSIQARAQASPVLARWRAEREARQRRLDLERARRVPDLTPSAGIRALSQGSEPTFVGGLSLPLPLFDRNRGAIDEASAALQQTPFAETQVRLELRRSLAESHATLRRAGAKLDAIRREVLPEAALAFEEMRAGYERGRFTYLDLLEARRTLLRARREELQTLLAAHLALAELERLVGAPLDTESNSEGRPDR